MDEHIAQEILKLAYAYAHASHMDGVYEQLSLTSLPSARTEAHKAALVQYIVGLVDDGK